MSSPVFITGVGKRVGLALAHHFLDHDIPVIGTYRRQHQELELLKHKGASLYRCDFYSDDELLRLTNTIKANHPHLRTIIHNASDWLTDDNPLPRLKTVSRMMRIHVEAPYIINLELVDRLRPHGINPADIIHITDYVAESGSSKHIAYAASKAALHNLTLSFAKLFAPDIKVNTIAPALVMFNSDDSESYKQKAVRKALIQKEGGVKEIIQAVTFLMDSGYTTGRTIHIDGGRHLA